MSAATPSWGPQAAVPHAQVGRKLGDHHVIFVAGGVIAAIVIVISAIAALVHPNPPPCALYCGPQSQPPLPAASTYTNRAHGFSIDYPAGELTVAVDQADLVEFHSDGGPIDFRVVRAASLDDAISQAQQQLDGSEFQDMQEVGSVRGAELGYVPGKGAVWSATYQPSDGGDSGPVRIAIIAAQSHGLTVVATMFSDYDSDTDLAPYGLSGAQTFDYPISGFHFPGQ